LGIVCHTASVPMKVMFESILLGSTALATTVAGRSRPRIDENPRMTSLR
jgi:hypothetical protein